jgi:hypothetical protein
MENNAMWIEAARRVLADPKAGEMSKLGAQITIDAITGCERCNGRTEGPHNGVHRSMSRCYSCGLPERVMLLQIARATRCSPCVDHMRPLQTTTTKG